MTWPPDLADLVARMSAADRAVLARYLPAGERLARRDAAIRAALARFYGGMAKTPAARSIAADLQAPPPAGTAQGAALADVLALNGGRALSWRQVAAIADGLRDF